MTESESDPEDSRSDHSQKYETLDDEELVKQAENSLNLAVPLPVTKEIEKRNHSEEVPEVTPEQSEASESDAEKSADSEDESEESVESEDPEEDATDCESDESFRNESEGTCYLFDSFSNLQVVSKFTWISSNEILHY